MSTTFESLMMLEGDEARPVLDSILREGEPEVFEALRRQCEPGSGTLISARRRPWADADGIYERILARAGLRQDIPAVTLDRSL